MKKTRNFSFFLCLALMIASMVILLKMSESFLQYISIAVYIFSGITLANISSEIGQGGSIDLKNIKKGVTFKCTYLYQSKEEMNDGNLKNVHIHHFHDGKHTYMYMCDDSLPNGNYIKNDQGELQQIAPEKGSSSWI